MKLTLTGLALLFAAALGWQWHGWPPPPVSVPAPADPATSGALIDGDSPPASDLASALNGDLLDPPPIEQYGAIRERPLFLPDRRPPPDEPELAEEPLPEEATDLAGMQLTAVVIAPNLVSAWVRSPGNAELLRLRIGDDLEGWSVTGIEPEQISLERQGATDTLKLRDFAAGTAAPPLPVPPTVTRQRERPPAMPGQPSRSPPPVRVPDRRRAVRGQPPGPGSTPGSPPESPPGSPPGSPPTPATPPGSAPR